MYRWRQNAHSEPVSRRALTASLLWILALLAGYFVLADWSELPVLASSVLAAAH